MEKGKRVSMLKKVSVAAAILIIAVILSWQLGLFKKNCKEDINCFSEALQNCRQAKYLHLQDYNYYTYTIKGSEKGNCVILVNLDKMAEGTAIQLVERFEGKSMACKLPKEIINETTVNIIQSHISYCSGPLKEAVYESIIEKLYGIVLNNIGDIVIEARDVLKGK